MNKKSVGVLGIVMLGGSSLALSCVADPSPPEVGGGEAGLAGSPLAGAGGSESTPAGAGGMAESTPAGASGAPGPEAGGQAGSGEGSLNEGGNVAQGGADPSAGGAAGEGGATAGAGGESNTGGSDVVGTVVDGVGAPVASMVVEIAGQMVTTDETGAFTVHHVPETYSAVIVFFVPPPDNTFLPTKTVEIYDELTTRSPQFRLVDLPPAAHQGAITGSVSGGAGFPIEPGSDLKFAASASNSDRGWAEAVSDLLYPTEYEFPVLLWGSEPANKYTVRALQWRAGVNGMPTSYEGWASAEVSLPSEPQYPEVTQDLVLTPVEKRTVTGTITKPADCTLAVQGTVNGIVLFNDVPTTATYSYVVPAPLSGAATDLTASCQWSNPYRGSSVSVGLAASNMVDLVIPSPPSLVQPAHEATGVTHTTPFSWAAGDNQLRVVHFEGGGWNIYRYGTGTSSTLPDLTRFGISIPASSPVSWEVLSFKLDAGAATTWDNILGTSQYDMASTGHAIFKGHSDQRTFMLAP